MASRHRRFERTLYLNLHTSLLNMKCVNPKCSHFSTKLQGVMPHRVAITVCTAMVTSILLDNWEAVCSVTWHQVVSYTLTGVTDNRQAVCSVTWHRVVSYTLTGVTDNRQAVCSVTWHQVVSYTLTGVTDNPNTSVYRQDEGNAA